MRIEDLRKLQDEEDYNSEENSPSEEHILRDQSRLGRNRAALRKAVAWSEVLGEPACRKRKRKAYGSNQSNIGRGRSRNTETA